MAQDGAGQAGGELAAEMRAIVRAHNEQFGARGPQLLIDLAPDVLTAWAGGIDALAAQVAALRAALGDTLPFLASVQCDSMQEGDALTALEQRIAALLDDTTPSPAAAGKG
jgi:hypothetical protein